MAGPGAGFEYPAMEVSWLKRDVLLFANSIGCTANELHFLYVRQRYAKITVNIKEIDDQDRSSTPTSKSSRPFKATNQEVTDFYARSVAVPIPGIPKLDYKRVVDGQRSIDFLKPVPATSAGRSFEIRSKVLGVYDKGKVGTVVETQNELVEK
ncbi:MAG: hypothetical protein LQ340_006637, partial [Diploschistes diacapsis]